MNREIIEKIIVSIVFGLIGFLLNFIPFCSIVAVNII